MTRLGVMLCGAALVAACGNKSPEQAAPLAQAPAEVQQAMQTAPAQPLPPPPVTVDACAMLSKADAESVIGALSAEPQAKPPQGSLLGECNYAGSEADSINVSVHPADEFESTIRYSAKKGEAQPVEGLGEKAFQTPYGLMIQPAGKSYFVVVIVVKGAAINGDAALAAGKKLKL
jgi:hypothetical protein